jgi:hypothetical protein
VVGSPLSRKIHTPTTPEGIVKDNSLLKMLENSLSDGALYSFRDPQTGAGDEDRMLSLLTAFWSAVRDVFTEALPALPIQGASLEKTCQWNRRNLIAVWRKPVGSRSLPTGIV